MKQSVHFTISASFREGLIFLKPHRLDLFNVSCVRSELLILPHCTQSDLTGCNSHHHIVIRALRDALLTFKPRPLTVTRHCLTTYVPSQPSDLK